MTWTWWALPGVVGALFALSAAIVVFRTAPHRRLNRRLSTVLALEGIWMSAATFFLVESQTVFMPPLAPDTFARADVDSERTPSRARGV